VKTNMMPCLYRSWEDTFSSTSYTVIDRMSQVLISTFRKHHIFGSKRKTCKGCQLNSDVFPTYSQTNISPKEIIKKERNKFCDIVKFPVNSLDEVKSFNIGRNDWGVDHSDLEASDVQEFKYWVYFLVDRLIEYFQFISVSSFIILLIYLDRYFKSNSSGVYTSMKCIKR